MATDSDAFNSFQFWREPLPSVDEELLGLLVSSGSGARPREPSNILDSGWPTAAAPDARVCVYRKRAESQHRQTSGRGIEFQKTNQTTRTKRMNLMMKMMKRMEEAGSLPVTSDR